MYLENYVHEERNAISSSHFAKKQSTLLVAAIWYKNEENIVERKYFAFVSNYLSHNDTFYGKCFEILHNYIQEKLPNKIERWINVTDGGNHFVSRYAYWRLQKFKTKFSKSQLSSK